MTIASSESRPGFSAILIILLLLFAGTGCAALIYEIVWSRQLVLVFGNTTQAVSAILTGFSQFSPADGRPALDSVCNALHGNPRHLRLEIPLGILLGEEHRHLEEVGVLVAAAEGPRRRLRWRAAEVISIHPDAI